jgi:predicted ATPase/class 3 adenylate cyclase
MGVQVAELPSGTVTFLFTDLEGSTRLWEADRDTMAAAVARHHDLLDHAVAENRGVVFSYMGDGIAAAFGRAVDAVAAAVDAQRALAAEDWRTTRPLRARMGIHTGDGRVIGGQYESHTLNRCARLMATAHGGQVVISGSTAELVSDELPSGVALVDLGEHRLRDIRSAMHVFQIAAPGLESQFPTLRSVDTPTRGLPAPLDRFVGRVHELREVTELLRNGRMLTLLGPGGTGKTRLAVHVASDLRDAFGGRVYFIDVTDCRDIDAFLSVTARSVGAHVQSDRPLLDAITEQLGSQPTLVVFDNFEQVTVAAATLSGLLRNCPALTVLVTSREALHMTGERVYPVPPLTLPTAVDPSAIATLAEVEAVQLFVERARAVRPEFELTAENAAAVIELCNRLDGLPLAIELATARLALLSPEALVERLGDRLGLLKGGARDAPERQRALRDTIGWSYDLLTADEQQLFALLSVFSGVSVEAAEAVAQRMHGPDGLEVLDGLGSLVQKSLLRESAVPGSGPRLSMLETIRAFAAERLAEDPDLRDRAQRAHAEYFAEWTYRYCEKLTGNDRDAAAERMAADLGNLAAAWRYWADRGDFEELGKLTDGLWLLYNVRGWHHETAALITDLLEVLSSTPSTEARLQQQIVLQTTLARVLLASQGYTAETERAYQRALELCETHGEFPQLLPVLRGLSTFFIYRAEFEKSTRLGEQLLALAERFDDDRARVEGHLVIGASEGLLARLQDGIDHLEQGIAAYDLAPRRVQRFEAGNDPGVVCHIVEAMLLWMQGCADRSRERAYEALEFARSLHHPQSVAYAHFHTGLIHLWIREPERAAEHARDVIDIAEAHEFQVWNAAGSCLLGAALAAGGSVAEGLARFEAGMDQYRVLRSPPVFLPSLLQMHATILGAAGRAGEGLARVDEALDVLAKLPEPQMLSSELALLKGSLLLEHSNDRVGAESWFARAVERADALDAPMLQLRACSALARVWHVAGRTEPAAELLRAAYERITEGFTTADLIEARTLLDDVAGAR